MRLRIGFEQREEAVRLGADQFPEIRRGFGDRRDQQSASFASRGFAGGEKLLDRLAGRGCARSRQAIRRPARAPPSATESFGAVLIAAASAAAGAPIFFAARFAGSAMDALASSRAGALA